MRRLAPLLLAAVPAWAEPISVPSGQPLEFIEAFWDLADEGSPGLRIRLLAPEIGNDLAFADVAPDFRHLCRTLGLPRLTRDGADSSIIIDLLDRPVPFGTSDPEAVQFFEAFRVEGGDCVWQGL